jgi:transposase
MAAGASLPILDARTWLWVPRRRVSRPRCGPKLERLSWLSRYSRVTKRLAESVARLCGVLPIKQVAAFFGLGWDAVKAINKRHLKVALGPIDLTGVSVIAMDELAMQKGHRYATVIVDPTIKKVLWMGRRRGRQDIRPFFELPGHGGAVKEGLHRRLAVAPSSLMRPGLVVALDPIIQVDL